MLLYVYDQSMVMLGVVEEMASLIWRRKYSACGSFSLLAPATQAHLALIHIGRLVMPYGGSEAGQIEYINIRKNQEGQMEMEVQGRFLPCWLGQRVLAVPLQDSASYPQLIRQMVEDNATAPADSRRAIPSLTMAQDSIVRPSVDYAWEPYQNLLTAVEDAAQASQIGFAIYSNPVTKNHVLALYEGVDRRRGNEAGNAPCVFSQEMDNILEQDYTISTESARTTAYVLGAQPQDGEAPVAVVGSDAAGLDRAETLISATDASWTQGEGEEQTTLTLEQYMAILSQRGADALESLGAATAFESQINSRGNLRYQIDYDLGDLVTCEARGWGVAAQARITQVVETYQAGSNQLEITFGSTLPTLVDQVRKMVKGGR